MKTKLKFILFIALFLSLSLYSQEIDSRKFINTIHKKYELKLKLNKNQSVAFKKVLKTYNPEIKKLISKQVSAKEFNKKIKLHDLEVYKILTTEQFANYKKIKIAIEEYKEYKK